MFDHIRSHQGEQIYAAALKWLGTPYKHQGRLAKSESIRGGVDCLGLLVGVARELRLKSRCGDQLSSFDRKDYTHAPDGEEMCAVIAGAMQEVGLSEKKIGDVMVFEIDSSPRHLAICGGGKMVHAYAPARKVVETTLDDYWLRCLRRVFRVC